jgi:hypothetical protein
LLSLPSSSASAVAGRLSHARETRFRARGSQACSILARAFRGVAGEMGYAFRAFARNYPTRREVRDARITRWRKMSSAAERRG